MRSHSNLPPGVSNDDIERQAGWTPPQDDSLPLAGTVLVEERNVYGSMKLYPANALARALCEVAHTTTVTMFMVKQFKAMGFTVHTTGAAPRQL